MKLLKMDYFIGAVGILVAGAADPPLPPWMGSW